MDKFTLKDFLRDFGTTQQCLAFLVRLRWPNGIHCKKCDRITRHHIRSDRKAYSCQNCGTLTYPTTGTIFEGTKVPLPDWFYVIFQFAKTRTGIAAKQIERELGVSYPTALRMCNALRSCLTETPEKFTGTVEVDETYIGSNPRYNALRRTKRGRGTSKAPVVGVVERGGKILVRVVPNVQQPTLLGVIREQVEKGATVYTDEFKSYDKVGQMGYTHDTVQHSKKQYVKWGKGGEKVHTNSVEGFWSYPKGAIKSVHRGVSRRKLPLYLDEYAFRHNHRKDRDPMFLTILRRIVERAQ